MGALFLVEATFAPAHGRTFYLVGAVTSGEVRVGMKLVLPTRAATDRTIRSIEHTTEPRATCLGLRYRDAGERDALLALDLRGRAVLVD